MKYKFVFDEGYLGDFYVELSKEEIKVVLITLAGGHNVMLSGYKTERLAKAIKLLRDLNNPFIDVAPNCTDRQLIGIYNSNGLKQGFVTDANNGYLHMVDLARSKCDVTNWLHTVMCNGWIKLCYSFNTKTLPAKFQLIAETNSICKNYEFRNVLKLCDVVYKCKEEDKRELYSIAELKHKLETLRECHNDVAKELDIPNICNRDIENIEQALLSKSGKEVQQGLNCNIKTIRVARTLADMYMHFHTFSTDVEEALLYS